jgi:hypothetical protein
MAFLVNLLSQPGAALDTRSTRSTQLASAMSKASPPFSMKHASSITTMVGCCLQRPSSFLFRRRRGERLKARQLCVRSLDQGLPKTIARRAVHDAAKFAKREGDIARAIELWRELASSPDPSFEALEQLAIYYERCERNAVEAIRVTHLAVNELRQASRLGFIKPNRRDRLSGQFKRRLARLNRTMQMFLMTPATLTTRSRGADN